MGKVVLLIQNPLHQSSRHRIGAFQLNNMQGDAKEFRNTQKGLSIKEMKKLLPSNSIAREKETKNKLNEEEEDSVSVARSFSFCLVPLLWACASPIIV